MNILNEIALRTKERINEKKKRIPQQVMMDKIEVLKIDRAYPFEKALQKNDVSFICEIKRASPTKGMIAEKFPYLAIANEYEKAGADAISVLTEPFYFKGDDNYLEEISRSVSIPLIRKDFTVDEYMIYEAKLLGASAVLLICAILSEEELVQYIITAHRLGLSCLVETHTEKEVESALKAGARIIGVNNRNLKTFEVDIKVSERLRKMVPKDKIFVSESGLKTPSDIEALRAMGADAALIGETFMRSANKTAELKKLRGGQFV